MLIDQLTSGSMLYDVDLNKAVNLNNWRGKDKKNIEGLQWVVIKPKEMDLSKEKQNSFHWVEVKVMFKQTVV